MSDLAVETKDLRIDYGTFCAVKSLNLQIPVGALYGLVGPNGAGKTSTLTALSGLLQPTHGEIFLSGYDLMLEPLKARIELSYMPDLAPVIPDLRISEFLEFYARMHRLPTHRISQRVEEVLKMVRMDKDCSKMGKDLSRGMTQRVVLAKALLHNPRILLLDEPASGMDPIARNDLWTILTDLCQKGVTVLLSSHILSELSEHCTHLCFMHLGEVRLQGPISEVMQRVKSSGARLIIETFQNQSEVYQFLANYAGISNPSIAGSRISCIYSGGEVERASLLRELVNRFDGISQFRVGNAGLENILMEFAGEAEIREQTNVKDLS